MRTAVRVLTASPKWPEGVALNPLSIARLKWYPAGYASFPMASDPLGMTFDGAHIWVTNYFSAMVTKLRVSDGRIIDTIVTTSNPFGIGGCVPNILQEVRLMYSLVKSLGFQQVLRQEGVPFLLAFFVAEAFYKFHSFTLETIAFLATWYVLSGILKWFVSRVGRNS